MSQTLCVGGGGGGCTIPTLISWEILNIFSQGFWNKACCALWYAHKWKHDIWNLGKQSTLSLVSGSCVRTWQVWHHQHFQGGLEEQLFKAAFCLLPSVPVSKWSRTAGQHMQALQRQNVEPLQLWALTEQAFSAQTPPRSSKSKISNGRQHNEVKKQTQAWQFTLLLLPKGTVMSPHVNGFFQHIGLAYHPQKSAQGLSLSLSKSLCKTTNVFENTLTHSRH